MQVDLSAYSNDRSVSCIMTSCKVISKAISLLEAYSNQERIKCMRVNPPYHDGLYSQGNFSQVIFSSLPASEILGESENSQSRGANVTHVDTLGA